MKMQLNKLKELLLKFETEATLQADKDLLVELRLAFTSIEKSINHLHDVVNGLKGKEKK